ncbi:Sensor protein ZraS [Planctomycetes bacterium Pan216]|uniref:histidine kinase n=1 Tax=Kolteria novifilia TaxID=2527975 RepID=A0A518AX17_9BACT|nr:Sensor protein ZraS [Planctomycetes bacterium Pan216]
MASLTVIRGPDRGRRFELTDSVPTIGRDATNAIRLHDTEASRHHAELQLTKDGYIVHDLKSSNGTFLNDARIDRGLLKTGDRVLIGQTELIFNAGISKSRPAEMAERISVVSPQQVAESSAILRAIKHDEGTAFLRNPERAQSRWLQNALSNLAVMYETSQAISRISDLDQLLDHIMDLIFSSLKPDRSCIVLRDVDTGKLEPTAVRFAEEPDQKETITLSRTIVDYVLRKEEGVIVLDASQDQRFGKAQSIVKLGIREAICVPLRGRHETLGVVYLDTKSDGQKALEKQTPVKFSDDHLRLMIAIAHQAGLAIEDTRFYQAMMQAERLAAIGQTIATLSHHIKNIMQGLKSGSYLVEMGLTDEKADVIEKGWRIVEKNQDKIYNLVMDMLSFSKEREPAWELSDLNEIVRDVAELMEGRAKDFGATIKLELDPELPEIAVDPEAIHRMSLNIVTNAIDAVDGEEEGIVRLVTSRSPATNTVKIVVSDNGCGIPEEQVERIFQIFSSTKGSRGSGLGLPVSRKIAREHGGDVLVTSHEGEGSTFEIELPMRTNIPETSADSSIGIGEMTVSDFKDNKSDPDTSVGRNQPKESKGNEEVAE